MKINFLSLVTVCCLFLLGAVVTQGQQADSSKTDNQDTGENKLSNSTTAAETPKALRFKVKSIDGKDVELSQYLGKVIVIVNTASRCGMTPQYKDLQELHDKYADQGLAILGFPCNQFGRQEPGTDEQIAEFCSKNYGVTFDMFSKIDVNGGEADGLFKYLTQQEAKPAGAGPVNWNFEKFVIGKDGNLIARFGSRVKPSSIDFVRIIEEALQ